MCYDMEVKNNVLDGPDTVLMSFPYKAVWLTLFNPLNAELIPICHLLALLGGATIVVVSRLRVKAVG